ncbi:hypothetical protein THIOSC13_1630007 [uncultured Thiomicrorhabdus sp.]
MSQTVKNPKPYTLNDMRQSMTWLHTWSGLVLGWLLFFVFFNRNAWLFRYRNRPLDEAGATAGANFG